MGVLSDCHSVSQHQSHASAAGGQQDQGTQAETDGKGSGLPAGSHIIITQYTPPRRIFASPWQYCNPHARYPSCNGPASRGSQAAPPTHVLLRRWPYSTDTTPRYCHLVQGQQQSTWRTDAHSIGSESPQSRDRHTIWGPRPAPMALLHARRNAHAQGVESCHGPLPLAGRLSCQSLRRNAVRGFGDFICSAWGAILWMMGTAPLRLMYIITILTGETLGPLVPQTTVLAVFSPEPPPFFR